MSFCHTSHGPFDLQQPFDAAVVIPTIQRPKLRRAVESLYAQDFSGRVQVLIGIDVGVNEPDPLQHLAPPPNYAVTRFWPGYSTSQRHGGLTPAGDGGCLRTVLTWLANSARVAYLDDDNAWAPNHLSTLLTAIEGHDWAFSYRWFVDPATLEPLAVDAWESGGPGQGVHKGGFVDPSCLMVDKTRCSVAPYYWTVPLPGDPMSADCRMFDYLSRHHSWRSTGEATAYYTLNPRDRMFAERMRWIEEAKMDASGYVAGVMARARLHGERKAEQKAEASRLRDEALADAAAHMMALELVGPDDAAHD